MHPKYRKDIDGLRAVAVIAVVIFHAFPELTWFRGGFIGVDIFFVISGYLIGTIILGGLKLNTFSFYEFYTRRIKRIFPALILVFSFSYLFGWFFLLDGEFQQLGEHIAAGSIFISNFLLWGEAGYFDVATEFKPLMHLWSLGIEEQFYIVWPFLLWSICRLKINILFVMVFVWVASLILNLWGISSYPTATFYLPLSRFWELLSGSLLAYLVIHNHSVTSVAQRAVNMGNLYRHLRPSILANLSSLLGVTLLCYGFYVINQNFAFPGSWAMIPIIGAILVILAGPNAFINHTILSNRVLVWVGLISYPLYLWHWPLLSFGRIIIGQTPSISFRISAVAVSIFFSWVTFRYLECRVRQEKGSKSSIYIFVSLMIAIGLVGWTTYLFKGIPSREVIAINNLAKSGEDGFAMGMVATCKNVAYEKLSSICLEDIRGGNKYVLIGDSKADVLYPGLVRTSNSDSRWILLRVTKPVVIFRPDQSIFTANTLEVVRAINADPNIKKVVVANAIRAFFPISTGITGNDYKKYNSKYLDQLQNFSDPESALMKDVISGLSEMILPLSNNGKKIIFVVDNPALPNSQDCIFRKTSISFLNLMFNMRNPDCVASLELFEKNIEIYRKMLETLREKFPNSVEIFNATEIYCNRNEGVCPAILNNRLMYSYTDHISDYAAGKVGQRLNNFLK